jgi:transposase
MGKSKYTYEFKKQVVNDYLNNEGGYRYITAKYSVSDKRLVRLWVANYKKYGDSGLFRSRNKTVYSFKKKLDIVELYLSSELSYQEIALQEGIKNPSVIAAWVNRYRIAGPDALRPQKKGKNKTLDKSKIDCKSIKPEEHIVDTSAEHVKELEEELLKLRIENAFLKELRRLRLEDEEKMRERRSSSTASEETSD